MKTISTFVIALLVLGFLFLALPEKGNAGMSPPGLFTFPGCCQFSSGPEGNECGTVDNGAELLGCFEAEGQPFSGETCNEETNLCSGFAATVPTLSQWGLITMVAILGVIGFMVIRRKKASA